MSKKYFSAGSSGSLPADSCTIITNDLFLASFLHCVGCELSRVERNDRRRVSFVFVGERVRDLREAYRSTKVLLDMNAFRASMNLIRDQMDRAINAARPSAPPEERSVPYVRTSCLDTARQQPTLQAVSHA